jgi:hypothetical protein
MVPSLNSLGKSALAFAACRLLMIQLGEGNFVMYRALAANWVGSGIEAFLEPRASRMFSCHA